MAYIEQGRGFGGAVTCLAATVGGLDRRRFRPYVLLCHDDPRSAALLARTGAVVASQRQYRRPDAVNECLFRVGRYSQTLKRLALLGFTGYELWRRVEQALAIARQLRAWSIDVVHLNNNLLSNLSGLLAAALVRVPTVAHIRGDFACGRLVSLSRRLVDRFVVVAEHMRSLPPLADVRDRISVVYDGVQPTRVHHPPSLDDLPRETVRIGHVGMFLPWKGQDLFIKAAISVCRARGNCVFYLVGDVPSPDDIPYKKRLLQMIAEAGCSRRIRLLGFRRDVAAVMRAMDVVVHSSVEPEPFGMVVLEAMAQGRAVIAAAEGGPLEIIQDGINGLLVSPRDEKALAQAMLSLIDAPAKRAYLGENAEFAISRRFSPQRACRQLESLYLALARGARQPRDRRGLSAAPVRTLSPQPAG